MTITLDGGAPGPENGGLNPLSGRTVQEVAPPAPKPQPTPPPVAAVPEMVEPAAKAAPKAVTRPVEKPAEKSSSRRPTTGAEVKTGSAKADTGAAPIPFGGLSTGGGPASGVALDVKNFCCPDYLVQMRDRIMQNWNRNQGAAGKVQVRFVIQKDGTITDVLLEKSSNAQLLDLESQRALLKTRQLAALPREFPDNTLTIHLIFEYMR